MGGREGEREGGREGGREGERERGREGERERGRERGRGKGGRERGSVYRDPVCAKHKIASAHNVLSVTDSLTFDSLRSWDTVCALIFSPEMLAFTNIDNYNIHIYRN